MMNLNRRIALVLCVVIVLPGCGTMTITRQYIYPERKPKVVRRENRPYPRWWKDIAYSYTWSGGY